MNKQAVNLDALLSYSPLQHKGSIPNLYGYIRFEKSDCRGNCCQGCPGIAFMLLGSSHRHCHHAAEAKKAKEMMAGIYHRSWVLLENTL